jgi:hypothetical protein
MAGVANGDPREEVEVPLALGVIERRALSANERDRLPRIGVHQMTLVEFPDR